MIIPVKTSLGGYDIIIKRGVLSKASEHLNLKRRVLIVTDDGVPEKYPKTIADCCDAPYIVTLPQGERTKCLANFELLLTKLTEQGFTRTDCVVAVGGGVMGDLAGFAASAYMRGIDFYNVPTTLLSQVDSSIGGKVAINFGGYKNTVGAFYPPRAVLIDPDTLCTLPERQISNGLSESVKMSLTSDAELFEMFEHGRPDIDTVIYKSLLIKKSVVEKDERESGLRKVLNFGHTIGHGIESASDGRLLHGECVALGMLTMCSDAVRERLVPVLKSLSLPTSITVEKSRIIDALYHDKKMSGDTLSVVYVDAPGSFTFKKIKVEELCL